MSQKKLAMICNHKETNGLFEKAIKFKGEMKAADKEKKREHCRG